MDKTTFAANVLHRLGISPSPNSLRAFVGWMNAEGGHWNNDAKYNPLNTTQSEPGAGNTGTQGNIKVYKSWQQGIQATVETLKNGRYGGIIHALKSGDPHAVANAIGNSPWGTTGSTIAGAIAAVPGNLHASAGATLGGSSTAAVPSAGRTQGTSPAYKTIPGESLLPQRQAAAASFLGQRGSSANQNLAFAQQISGLQDQPDQRVRVAGAGIQAANSTGSALPGRTGSSGLDYTARANALDSQHLPYQWGGGHGGKVNPYKATPVDCSGAVSAVLGIDPRVSGQFETFGKPGRAPGGKGVTIYANAHHVLMEVDGHFFGTSASNPGGGAGWIKRQDISPQYLRGFTVRHTDA